MSTDRPAKLTVLAHVFDRPDLSANEKCVLASIVLRTNETFGDAFPGARSLARAASISKRDTVFVALKRLEALGLIARKSGGLGRSNNYTVDTARIAAPLVAAQSTKTRPVQRGVPISGTPRQSGHDPSRSSGRDPSRSAGHYPVHDPVSDPVDAPKQCTQPKTRMSGALTKVEQAAVSGAVADYNKAAEALGLSHCASVTSARSAALLKRLRDIGAGDLDQGRDRFRDALSAIGHDRFLSGKIKPKDGQKPFRLNLDRLLSTGSRMGDVLAKLLDLHAEHGPAQSATPSAIEIKPSMADLWAPSQAEQRARDAASFAPANHAGSVHDFH